jgi:hypothetical protein
MQPAIKPAGSLEQRFQTKEARQVSPARNPGVLIRAKAP